jgi:cytochrome P450
MPSVAPSAFDPLDPDFLQCPHAAHARLRAEASVHHVGERDLWFVSRHDPRPRGDPGPETYSSTLPLSAVPLAADDIAQVKAAMAEGLPRTPAMINADGQVHARYRRLVSTAFSPSGDRRTRADRPGHRRLASCHPLGLARVMLSTKW